MDHSFQIRRLPILENEKFVMENMVLLSCEVFQRMDINNKWSAVKKEKLCFCYLGDDHCSNDCKRKRKCGVKDCDKDHHKLLHFQKKDDSIKRFGDRAS